MHSAEFKFFFNLKDMSQNGKWKELGVLLWRVLIVQVKFCKVQHYDFSEGNIVILLCLSEDWSHFVSFLQLHRIKTPSRLIKPQNSCF